MWPLPRLVRIFVAMDDGGGGGGDDDSGVHWLIKHKNHQSVLSLLWPLTWRSFPFFVAIQWCFQGACSIWPVCVFLCRLLLFLLFAMREHVKREVCHRKTVNRMWIISYRRQCTQSRWLVTNQKTNKSQMLRVFSANTRQQSFRIGKWNKATKKKNSTEIKWNGKKSYQRQEITWQ